MPSIAEAKVDPAELAERLRRVANALRLLPANHPRFFEEMADLGAEVRAVAALLSENANVRCRCAAPHWRSVLTRAPLERGMSLFTALGRRRVLAPSRRAWF